MEDDIPLQEQITDKPSTDFKDALARAAKLNRNRVIDAVITLGAFMLIVGPLAYDQYTDINAYLTPAIQGCSLQQDSGYSLDNCYNLSVPNCLNDTMTYDILNERPDVLSSTVAPLVVILFLLIFLYELIYIRLLNRKRDSVTLLGETGIFLSGRSKLTTSLIAMYFVLIFANAVALVIALRDTYTGNYITCKEQTVYLQFEDLNKAAVFFKTAIIFALVFKSGLMELWTMSGNPYDITLQDLVHSTDNPKCLTELTEIKIVSTSDWDKIFAEYTKKMYNKSKQMGD